MTIGGCNLTFYSIASSDVSGDVVCPLHVNDVVNLTSAAPDSDATTSGGVPERILVVDASLTAKLIDNTTAVPTAISHRVHHGNRPAQRAAPAVSPVRNP
jgi:hypothetical protein